MIYPASTQGAGFFCGKILLNVINVLHLQYEKTNQKHRITIDHDNIMEATQILLLNGFIKKSTKDYKSEITKAKHIIERLQNEEENR